MGQADPFNSLSKNLKIVVDNLTGGCIVCFRISPFASKEVEVFRPTPTNAKIVCAINKADEGVSSNAIALSERKIARKKGYFFAGFTIEDAGGRKSNGLFQEVRICIFR